MKHAAPSKRRIALYLQVTGLASIACAVGLAAGFEWALLAAGIETTVFGIAIEKES